MTRCLGVGTYGHGLTAKTVHVNCCDSGPAVSGGVYEVDAHGRELSAVCDWCDNAITQNEAEDNGGACDVCADDPDRRAERAGL